MAEHPPVSRPANAAEVKAYLNTKVYPVLNPSIEALLRHVFTAKTKHVTEEESLPFSPLSWLSDHLRQHASSKVRVDR